MRSLFLLLLLGVGAAAEVQVPVLTAKDQTMRNAKLVAETPDRIKVTHEEGVAILSFADLPPKIAEQLGLTAAAAKSYQEQKSQDDAAKAEAARRGEIARARAVITEKTKTINEVETDQLGFLDRPFVVHGSINVSSYYNYGYENAAPTHYAFELSDGTGRAHCYMPVEAGAALRKQILAAGTPLYGTFTLVIPASRYSDKMSILAELIVAAEPVEGFITRSKSFGDIKGVIR